MDDCGKEESEEREKKRGLAVCIPPCVVGTLPSRSLFYYYYYRRQIIHK
jgi:hypothetical protein